MAYISIEKDLIDSIKFRRLVKNYSNALVTRDKTLLPLCVTTLLGGLVKFWLYADSYIDDSNVLTVTLDEINEIVGIDHFAQALPLDWLVILDAEHVQLPNYLEHNGTSAKKRKQNAQRQANYRHRLKLSDSNALLTRDSRVTVTHNDAIPIPIPIPKPDKRNPLKPPFDESAITGLDLDAWQDWVAYRAKRKPAIKPASMQKAAESLAALGTAQRATVDNSIANGYQGLFAPNTGTNGNGKHRPTRYEQLTAKLDAEISAGEETLASDDGSLRLALDGDVWQ